MSLLTVRRAALVAALSLAPWGLSLSAQAPFTVEDVLDLRTVSLAEVSPVGDRVLVSRASLRDRLGGDNYRYGDPTYTSPSLAEWAVVATGDGEEQALFDGKRQVRSPKFSPDGRSLAMLVREGADGAFRLAIHDVATGRTRTLTPPVGRSLSENTSLSWTGDGTRLLVSLRDAGWEREARERFRREVEGPIVVRSSEDPFLSWEEIRRYEARQIPALVEVGTGAFRELGEEALFGAVALTEDGRTLRFERDLTEKTSYEEIFGRELSLRVKPVSGGEERTLFASTRGMRFLWSGDGRTWVYGKDGGVFTGTLERAGERKLAGPATPRDSASAPPDSAARERARRERFTPLRLSHDGSTLIASNSEGLWFIDVASGRRDRFLDTPPADEDEGSGALDPAPRWSVAAWSRDGHTVYLLEESRTAWERALHRLDRRSGERSELLRGEDDLGELTLSRDGRTLVFTRTAPNRPSEVWAAADDLSGARRLAAPDARFADRALGQARLVDYLDVDGNKLRGVLYLPPGWREGTRLPTVFLVYEQFFEPRFNGTVALLNARGYAVMQPSVRLERGFPGEAWLKGVTAAANKLIDLGIADPERLGVHGTSYGGYATNLLVTQTDRFKAAINISGKVDMISFYTDSPRLGVRNIHAPENSQDRIGATLWEQPQKYIAHSAIMFADRIDTPLLLLTGQQDHNVPERTTSEMFYALRRLGKRVEWVSYIDGGHGMPTTTEAEVVDYHQRILGWYDRWLKGIEAQERVTTDATGAGS